MAQARSFDTYGYRQSRPHTNGTVPSPRVLVVDDERYIVELLAFLLEEEGFIVDRAYDGEQAWKLVERAPPDLVITDVSMPRVNGLELLKRFRATRALATTPVILMSAALHPAAGDHTAFVPKPFDLDQILSLVETELKAS